MAKILQPMGETVYVNTAYKSHSQCYHVDENCSKMKEGNNDRAIDKAVAEWHELDPCTYCHDNEPHRGRKLTSEECSRIRAELIGGHPAKELVKTVPLSMKHFRKHVRGECTHEVSHPPAEFKQQGKKWVQADE